MSELARFGPQIERLLARIGQPATISKVAGSSEDGTMPEDTPRNRRGKPMTDTDGDGQTDYEVVGEWPCFRGHPTRQTDANTERDSMGSVDTEAPLMILPADAVVETGYRIEYKDKYYQADEPQVYPSHKEVKSVLQQNSEGVNG